MAKKARKNFKKGKAYKPKVKSKLIKAKYTGPGPRQVTAAAIARRNKAEDERNDDDGSNERRVNRQEKRQRVIRMY
jgi:hypothetical protein